METIALKRTISQQRLQYQDLSDNLDSLAAQAELRIDKIEARYAAERTLRLHSDKELAGVRVELGQMAKMKMDAEVGLQEYRADTTTKLSKAAKLYVEHKGAIKFFHSKPEERIQFLPLFEKEFGALAAPGSEGT
jgi:hypothetical protein